MRTKEVQLRVSLTGRYATALYKEAAANKSIDLVLQDIHSFQNLLTSHQEIERIFKSKFFQNKRLIPFIEELGSLKNFSPLFVSFLKTLVAKGRCNLIKTIFSDFLSLTDIQANVVPVQVEVAKMNKKDLTSIEKLIKKNHPKQTYRFEYRENPELLGGFRAFIYDQCLDYSLMNRLNRLSHQLKEA